MADDLTRPYIGYRSAGRRPERNQDRRASADAPLAALRGMISGVAGAPGDIESLVRMLPGLSEQTVLPTSEDIERRLPLRSVSETPVGRAATGIGTLGGGFYTGPGSPLRALAGLPSAVSRAGRDFAMAAGQPAVNVIKPKGGNWLAGSVEKAVEPMKRADPGRMTEEQLLRGAWENMRPLSDSEQSINRWLESKLAKYIRNEMATPEDPLRLLADRGVTHIPEGLQSLERETEWIPETLEGRRAAAGFPRGGMSQTPYGQGWEQLADEAIQNLPAGERTKFMGDTPWRQQVQENPWLMKVPPETMTYGAYPVEVRQELGFEHLVDELRNAINPASGLPENLRWKYQDLEKVTVPQAVQRVADINAWRAAQKAEADLMRAQNAATFTHKEYPEAGFRWVELRQPEAEKITQLPEGWRVLEDSNAGQKYHYVVNEHGGTIPGSGFIGKTPEEAIANTLKGLNARRETQALEDALKYEGETMGHCVGGYCPDVIEGRSRIYSLRDKKGQPHVTIEVKPGAFSSPEEALKYEQAPENGLSSIIQIKGKANRAPNAEYLPYVQDFVRSGQWGRVGDLGNTGLVEFTERAQHIPKGLTGVIPKFKESGITPGYYREDELADLIRSWQSGGGETGLTPGARGEGFAEGGLVGGANFPTYDFDPDRIESIVGELHAMNAG